MKNCLLLFSLLVGITSSALAQTGAKAKPVRKEVPRDTSLCNKRWTLVSVEEWGVVAAPKKKQVDDYLKMAGNGTYNLKRNGDEKSGTWTRSGPFITFVNLATGEKFNYKVVRADEKTLRVDFRDPDETHSFYEFDLK